MNSSPSTAYKEILSLIHGVELLCGDDSGCFIGRLVYLAGHDFMKLTSVENQTAALDSCYDVQALLNGAFALAEDDEYLAQKALLELTLAKLDAYTTWLDIPGSTNPDYVPETAESISDEDYLAGMHLARDLLATAEEVRLRPGDLGGSDSHRWYRGGTALNAFAKPFVQRVASEPCLIDGFAAGVSCMLFAGVALPVGDLDLPVAEYQAGAQGADGTVFGDEGAPWASDQIPPSAPHYSKPRKAAARKTVAA